MAETTKQWVTCNDYNNNKSWKAYSTLRESAILTSGYVDSDYVDFAGFNKVSVQLQITPGSLSSIDYKIYQSSDASIWYVEPTETVVSGLITHVPAYYTCPVTASIDNYQFCIPFSSRYVKVSVKGTNVTGSALRIDAEGVI